MKLNAFKSGSSDGNGGDFRGSVSKKSSRSRGVCGKGSGGIGGAELTALAAEAVAEAMAAEKVRAKEELLSQLSQSGHF